MGLMQHATDVDDVQAADVQAAFDPQKDGQVDRNEVSDSQRVYAPTSYADPADAPGSRATIIEPDGERPLGRLAPGSIEARAEAGEDTSSIVDASPRVGSVDGAAPYQDRAVTEHAADLINSKIADGGTNVDGREAVTPAP